MEPTFRLSDTEHTFTPFGGPLDDRAQTALIADIGQAVMAWARLEYILTVLAVHINKRTASSILHHPDPTTKLRGLIKLVRKWLKNHEPFSNFRTPEDDKFFESLLELTDLRNEIVHALLESTDATSKTFTTRRILRTGKDTWSPITAVYSTETPQVLAARATLAARHFIEICKLVFPYAAAPTEKP